MGERGAGAGDAEQAKSNRVKERERMVDPVKLGTSNETDNAGSRGRGEVTPVAKRGRRDDDQEIADDPARERDDECQHDDAQEVELGADTGQAAAEPEDERAREVQDEDQRGVKAGDHRCSLCSRPSARALSTSRLKSLTGVSSARDIGWTARPRWQRATRV